ncbi:MAG: hypothetical protein HS104_41665 [Polyangiaceae bacterium]|nr:hypothetical protein [Polyangiaceae bacterium]MCE7892522.1 hypothetical protein [Sorangiineae bacterium PRO1]MCL4751578.1 hypothetical protein [Myxococcales bacterium]
MLHRAVALTAFCLVSCGSPPPPATTAPTATAAPPPAAPTATAEPAPVEDAGSTAATPETPPPEEDTSGSPRERLMRAHFKETAVIRKAVIDGALAATVKPAAALESMKGLGTVQGSWKPSLDALGKAAKRFGQSPDLPSATAAIADIGVACGSCHKAAGGPKLQVEAPPVAGKTLEDRMKRHAWASERLWEGLYVPSDAAWKAGADALVGEEFPKEVLAKGGVHARSAAVRFGALVPTAAAKKSAGDRAKLYAELLETCSACHMAARGK